MNKPTLAVITHYYLREAALISMKKDVDVLLIAPADSPLHNCADYSLPIPDLDMDDQAFVDLVENAIASRGIEVSGIISMRDGNVLAAAKLASRNGWPSTALNALQILKNKFSAREWLNQHISSSVQTPVVTNLVKHGATKAAFYAIAQKALQTGAQIFKPVRGSCKTHVHTLKNEDDIEEMYSVFESAQTYRGGDFVFETRVLGKEYSVETIVDEEVRKILITSKLEPDSSDVFYETGHFVPCTDLSETQKAAVVKLVKEIHEQLELKNMVTHTEVMVPCNGELPAIIEVNPRIGGDLIPVLHKHSRGLDIYNIAARIATGLPLAEDLLGSAAPSQYAIMRFARPGKGILTQSACPAAFLKSKEDRFNFLFPLDQMFEGVMVNDDRPAYAMLTGDNLELLKSRANLLVTSCIAFR